MTLDDQLVLLKEQNDQILTDLDQLGLEHNHFVAVASKQLTELHKDIIELTENLDELADNHNGLVRSSAKNGLHFAAALKDLDRRIENLEYETANHKHAQQG